mmetsp:Transcript_34706/g.99679  ORF Transcript_34706/g.99679 Transcript_34706/m.99679 type:complete len:249 (-) Transcript_34706:66-812(-)
MTSYTYHCLALVVIGLLVKLPQSVRPSEPEDDDAFSERSAVLAADEADPQLAAASASALAALSGVGVEISNDWLGLVFDVIDDDGSGKITQKEWAEEVTKAWGTPMWEKLDDDGGGDFEKEEFFEKWDDAVSAAFTKLGGDDDGKITAAEREKTFKGAKKHELALANTVAGDDKDLDRGEFEEFVYTDIAFEAMNPEEDDSISVEDFGKIKKACQNQLLQDIPDKKEMKITDLYNYFKTEKMVFKTEE